MKRRKITAEKLEASKRKQRLVRDPPESGTLVYAPPAPPPSAVRLARRAS